MKQTKTSFSQKRRKPERPDGREVESDDEELSELLVILVNWSHFSKRLDCHQTLN
jgi:hypothetical protein